MKKSGFYLISLVLAAADLIFKEFAERRKTFRIVKNSGFAGSSMKDRPKFVTLVSTVFTAGIALYIAVSDENGRVSFMKNLGWSICLGGALSNTADRIRKKYVVDYIPIGKYVYNISDFFVYTGALIAGVFGFFEK